MAIALIAALLVWQLSTAPRDVHVVMSDLVAADEAPYDFINRGLPALSPDGESIVFAARTGSRTQLWIRRLDSPLA